jgi:hypothetical protein
VRGAERERDREEKKRERKRGRERERSRETKRDRERAGESERGNERKTVSAGQWGRGPLARAWSCDRENSDGHIQTNHKKTFDQPSQRL